MIEKWLPVPGLEDRLAVSDQGRVRTPQGRVLHGDRLQGYPRIRITIDGKKRPFKVHRLVMLAFVGPCPSGHQVAHDDGDRSNPKLANLSYKTCKENHADKVRHGTSNRGERHGIAKLTSDQVLEIKRSYRRRSRDAYAGVFARRFGVSRKSVENVIHGRTWGWLNAEESQ